VASSQKPLIALAGAGAAAALGVIGAVAIATRGLSSASSGPAPGASGQGSEVGSDGMTAPGTSALRQLGCDPAIVIDMSRLLGDAAAVRPGEPRYVVTCDVPGMQAPTCERVASTYFGAVGGSAVGNVDVGVAHPGAAGPLCNQLYAPSGALIR
jgi:hypothetical protein